MKTKCYIFLLASVTALVWGNFQDLQLHSDIALLIDYDTQKVLYEKNADLVVAPASITKVATALYTLKEIGEDVSAIIKADQDCVGSITDQMQKDLNFKHPPHWLVIGGTHMSIAKGDELSLEELLYGLMLISANDAANIIAKYVSGSIPQFMADLNDYISELGCQNTHFKNPHGSHLPGHVTTARDMAIITSKALQYPLFQKIIHADSYARPSLRSHSHQKLYNTNLLVRPNSRYYFSKAIGGKTGTHSVAKNTLVAAASHEGRNLLVVLMQCPEYDWTFVDAKKLFEAAFSEKLMQEVYLKGGPQPFTRILVNHPKKLRTYLKDDVTLNYYPSEKPSVKGTIQWHENEMPIHKGDTVATLFLKDGQNRLLKEVPLQAAQTIKKSAFMRYFFTLCAFIALILGARLIIKFSSKAR